MKQTKIARKGYTIEVESWENDGDHGRKQSMTVKNREEALKIKQICEELFPDIGNSKDREYDWVIDRYIADNPEMELTVDYINNLAYKLMGGSGDYDYRVCESVQVTYLEEDVYAQVID